MSNKTNIDELAEVVDAQNAALPEGRFDYDSVSGDIDGLLMPMLTAIVVDEPRLGGLETGLPMVLQLQVVINTATWHSIRYLCRQGGLGWQPDFIFATPPLARTILDSLFNTIFMFDNPTRNVHWFMASGWSEQHKAHARYVGKYGNKPAWKKWLELAAADIEQTERFLVNLSPDEKKQPTSPIGGFWPNPGKMGREEKPKTRPTKGRPAKKPKADYSMKDADRKNFLKYLSDWYYGRLSGDSHLSLTGLLNRGAWHLPLAGNIDRRDFLDRTKSNFAAIALTVYIALMTEIGVEVSLDKAQLRKIWEKLVAWPDAEDLYKERYESLLE